MILPAYIKLKIEERTGKNYSNPSDKDIQHLSQLIAEETSCLLGVNTLKRLLGCISDERQPRPGTLNAIAQFLGSKDWTTLLCDVGQSSSSFVPIEGELRTVDLLDGQVVEITYLPDRRLQFVYLGNEHFEVMLSENSKLRKGDICIINSFILNYPLIARSVMRNDTFLGCYTAARLKGLMAVKLLS